YGHHQVAKLLIKAQADIDLAYCSPLYMAAQEGHCKVIESLVRAQAEVNLQTVIGSTPLYVASLEDRYQAVELLIKAQADVDLQDFDGFSPLYIASEQGYLKVTVKLIIEFCIRNGIQGSYLKQGLRCAEEFENDRVVELFHAATSLDDSGINVEKYHTDEYFVVGSFAEGWGNSLVTLDGRTDFDSDVDVMWLTHGKPFHLKDFCECADRTSNPARSYLGFNQRPTLDEVPAHRLCRYPPIAPLQPDRVAKSNIFPAVLQSIQRDVTSASSPCHIVHAAPPGKAGEQLR
uniref:ANK_REP_REGION domain-containing protein n=1 Tax=Macrostomum lignano TaxID=282301 RepID=A0A1I8J2C6_9PLAT